MPDLQILFKYSRPDICESSPSFIDVTIDARVVTPNTADTEGIFRAIAAELERMADNRYGKDQPTISEGCSGDEPMLGGKRAKP